MLSPFYCMISYRVGTSFRVPELGPPFLVKRFEAWNRIQEAKSSKVDSACVRFLSVMASYHHHSLHSRSYRRWSKVDPRSMFGTKAAPCNCGTPRPPFNKKLKLDAMSEEMIPTEPASKAFNISFKGISVLVLTLNTLFGGQQAYADLRSTVQPKGGVEMEGIRSSAPSVEAILAKQLARRFREMSDEELVDILQQLLKASGGVPPSTQNSVDDGITPEDLVIKKENRKVGMKTPEGIREEVQIPEVQGPDIKVDKKVGDKNKYTGAQPASGQVDQGIDKMIPGKAPLPQAEEANVQADKRTSERIRGNAKVSESEDHDLPMTRTRAEKIIGDAKRPGMQQKTVGGNNTVPLTAETSPREASGASKSIVPDRAGATGAAELSSREPEDENATSLLWAELSRRTAGQVVPESQTSSSFSAADFWQNLQSYSGNVAMEVVALTAVVFERSKVVVGIVMTCSLFLALAFYFGRFRASSGKDMSKSKEPPTEDQDNQNLPFVSSDGMTRRDLGQGFTSSSKELLRDPGSPTIYGEKELMAQDDVSDAGTLEDWYKTSDQPRRDKWWKRMPGEGVLTDVEETAARSFTPSTSGQSPRRSFAGAGGKLAKQVSYPSNPLTQTRRELVSSMGRGSDADDVISSEMERQKQQGGKEAFVGSNAPLYPPTVSVTSLEINSNELQAADHQPHPGKSLGQRGADWIDATNVEGKGEEYSRVEEGDQRKPPAGDQKGIRVVQAAENTNTDSNLKSQFTSPRQSPTSHQKRAAGHWDKAASSASMEKSFDSDERVRHTASATQFGSRNGNYREGEGETASQSEPELNSFVHDNDLWVRDADGIFIQQAERKEERESGTIRGSSSVRQDMPESSSRAERISLKVKGQDLPSTEVPKESRKQSRNWFDYRQLVIVPSEKFPIENQQELGTDARESGPAAPRGQQLWPLRYGSVREKFSE